MQHTHSEEQLDRVLDALSSAAGPEIFPEALELPDAIEELRRWMSDERQWRHAPAASWRSLLDDLRRTIGNIPDAVLTTAGDPSELRQQLDLCRAEVAKKEIRREALLLRRLGDLSNRLASGLATAAARQAAWELLESSTDDESALSAARLLLTLVRLSGHDREVTRKQLTYRLEDSGVHGPLAPSWHRLQRAAQRATIEPAVGRSVVWLQLSLATVEDPGVIDLGAAVRVFAASRLVEALDAGDRSLVPEVGIEDDSLRSLCAVSSAHSEEVPVAVVRVEIVDVAAADAVQLARRTAATLGALGTFHGASSTLWTVEGSFVSFREGRRSAATFQAATNDRAGSGESRAMNRDPTALILDHERERLGRLLPVRGGRMLGLAELLLWLQDARAAPDAARLVLCDRAIESVSGWVGAATPRRFVEDHLIPSWALGRIHAATRSIAFEIVYNDDRERFFEHLPEHREWRGLMDDDRLDLRKAAEGHAAAGLAGMLEHIDLLNAGVPAGHRARRALDRLLIDAASPKAAAAWFDRLVERGRVNESRRSRTRNALMHGGPLSAATVSTVLPFAQYMADESLGRALDALLADQDAAAVFLERSRDVARVRRYLKAAVPIHKALN